MDVQVAATTAQTAEAGGLTVPLSVTCAIIGGVLGGISSFLANITFSGSAFIHEQEPFKNKGPFFALLGINTLLGITGAFVSQLILILLHKFPESSTTEDIIFLFCVCLVGGFGARRFLPIVVINIEEAVQRMFRETEQNRKEIKQARGLIHDVEVQNKKENEETLLISTVQQVLVDPTSSAQHRWAVEKMISLEKEGNLDANGYIMLGRLYKKQKEYRKAIDILSKYINSNQNIPVPNVAYHTAVYNRACYYSLLYNETKDPGLASYALGDLKLSLRYSAHLEIDREYARQDPDLAPIRNDPHYLEIIDTATVRPTEAER